jgi:hypothetical protein
LGGSEEGYLVEQGADAVEADFGGGMEVAEGAGAGEVGWQDMLEEAAHELQGLQRQGCEFAGFAVAVDPLEFALGQESEEAIGGGGLEDVTGEIAQGVLA